MKRNLQAGLGLLLILVGLALFVLLVVRLSSSYLEGTSSTAQTTCSGTHASHEVTIKNGTVSPAHTDGRLCDTLTITNLDPTDRLMAFGRHDDHVPYDGIGEKTLAKNQNLTVILINPGDYLFHDHLHDAVRGTFTVTK